MKAKMPDKPAETATYLCNKCNKSFDFKEGTLTCPSCHNTSRKDMVPIYVRDNPAEEKMYTPEDWHGG